MTVLQIKKYKTIKDENGNKIQILKTKQEWNKETKNGTATWYFYARYRINNKIKQYKSGVFALKREAESEENLFKVNPIEYIKTHSKRAKIDIIDDILNSKTLNDYFKDYCEHKKNYIKGASIYENKKDWDKHISPDLGDLNPDQLSLPIIQNWFEKSNNKYRETKNKITSEIIKMPYSTKSKNKWYSTLAEFFEYLKAKGLIQRKNKRIIELKGENAT